MSEPAPKVGILDWILFVPFILAFLGTLLFFELVQRLAFRIGLDTHQRSVRALNRALLRCLRLVGTRFEIDARALEEKGGAHIVVSNHQSMFDIPLLDAVFSTHQPRFIAKQELGRGIPSVSYNLRMGGAALIDRSNPRQALPEIKRLGRDMEDRGFAAAIFPEGTRAKDGVLKDFHHAGISALMSAAPSADLIPVVIDGSWKLATQKRGPIPHGITVRLVVLPSIKREGLDAKTATQLVRAKISDELARLRAS